MISLLVIPSLILLPILIVHARGDPPVPPGAPPPPAVTYDARSLIINGKRELIISGSIHYPRSTPDMWPDLIRKAKEGGLNTIQTYVFWNIHEPVRNKWEFEGNKDFVKFIKLVAEQGMWVTLRFGPYVAAEWNLGGFPYWLKLVPKIHFRNYNEPFMFHMKRYLEKIIGIVKEAKLFVDQGGPIILAQVENEYDSVQVHYDAGGPKYVTWAAETALSLYSGVPWIMCKQKKAPDPIIMTCNGRKCGDLWGGPGPNKPWLWTENWTQQYRVYGDNAGARSAEDISYHVARFFSKNGALVNYYMYHGGTNFGRTPSSFVTSRYYDEAPLDEYGLLKDPKYGHLRDLHTTLKMSQNALLTGTPHVQKISKDLEITTYEAADTGACVAFLLNNHTLQDLNINFRGVDYLIPSLSISILPDCKTVLYNTHTVVSQHSEREFVPSAKPKINGWVMYREKLPSYDELTIQSNEPLELFNLNKDASDYAWYTTILKLNHFDLQVRPDNHPVIGINSLGHALHAFSNGEYLGFGHGNNDDKQHDFKKKIKLKAGPNQIHILAMTVGIPNSGASMERRYAGPKDVKLQGLMSGTIDITQNIWRHQVGLEGEKLQIFTEEGSKRVQWAPLSHPSQPLTWYKAYFDAPEGNSPVVLQMRNMSKGMLWINGRSIGHYWVSFLSPEGKPTQAVYHVPRSFMNPTNNLIVVFEEMCGDPNLIELQLVKRDVICSILEDNHPPNVNAFEMKDNKLQEVVPNPGKGTRLTCPDNKVVEKVEFASYGNVEGACSGFKLGSCNSPKALKYVEDQCLGKHECTVSVDRNRLLDAGNDPCLDIQKKLAVQVRCRPPPPPPVATAS